MTARRSALRHFLASEASGGIVLMVAAAGAMVIANSPLSADYFDLLHLATGPVLAASLGPMTVHLWINDGLMALFFLLVGLEIKRELIVGQLASAAERRLPVIAALAGMVVPALLYLAITGGAPGLRAGWAIPAATDIAFAVGILALLRSRVPVSLKLLLTSVAIVDDMGAVAIIAIAYGHGLNLLALAGAVLVAGGMYALNRRRVTVLWPYLAAAVLLWLLVLQSGVHATIAGVVAALMIPVATNERRSPLHRLEHALSPWVAFAIVPLFAFANAGVPVGGVSLAIFGDSLVLGIALALFLGKQIGVFGGIWIAVRLKLAPMPVAARWSQVYGIALLAGIGFTMSLFIGGLAFSGGEAVMNAVKIGVLAGSIVAALGGYCVLRFTGRRPGARQSARE